MWIVRVGSILVFMLCLVAPASRAQSVQSDFDRSFNFTSLRTFGFTIEQRAANDPLAKDSLNDGRIKAALESRLSASGFRKETAGKQDFVVAYYVTAKDKVDLQEYSYGPFLGRRGLSVDRYTEGTLTLDLIDPATKRVVWRGRAAGAIELKNVDKKIDKAVEKLVNRFLKDVKQKKSA